MAKIHEKRKKEKRKEKKRKEKRKKQKTKEKSKKKNQKVCFCLMENECVKNPAVGGKIIYM
jgi:hypothetical protein